MRNVVFFLFAFALAAVPSQVSRDGVSVPMRNEDGVLLLSGAINGVGPLLFTFDPGASDTYTRYARERLNGRQPQTVCFSSACFPAGMQYFADDPSQLFPRHDSSLGTIAGSIGPALLRHYVARIDYRANAFTLIPATSFQPPRGAQPLPVSSDSAEMPAIAGTVDGRSGLFELDVRAPTSMLFTPFLERTGLRDAYAATPVVKTSATLVAHAIRSVRIGGTELHDVPFWFSTASSGKFAAGDVAGLFGNNVLSHFVVTIDLPHRVVYLGH